MMMPVEKVMSDHIPTVNETATVAEAITVMKAAHSAIALVTHRTTPTTYGLVTAADIVSRIAAYGRDPKEFSVVEAMSPTSLAVSPELGVEYAARLMANSQIQQALVLRLGTPGIVTALDIFYRSDFDTRPKGPLDTSILADFKLSRWH
ncbi:MAG: CBS domain-containing protein [Cyanobacteria bacterium J06628_6]